MRVGTHSDANDSGLCTYLDNNMSSTRDNVYMNTVIIIVEHARFVDGENCSVLRQIWVNLNVYLVSTTN